MSIPIGTIADLYLELQKYSKTTPIAAPYPVVDWVVIRVVNNIQKFWFPLSMNLFITRLKQRAMTTITANRPGSHAKPKFLREKRIAVS